MSPLWCEHIHTEKGLFNPWGKGLDADAPRMPSLSPQAVPLSNITSPWGISWTQDTSLVLNPQEIKWAQVGNSLV